MDVLTRPRLENWRNSIEIINWVTPSEFVSAAATARNETSIGEKSAGSDRIAVITGERPIDIGADFEAASTIVP